MWVGRRDQCLSANPAHTTCLARTILIADPDIRTRTGSHDEGGQGRPPLRSWVWLWPAGVESVRAIEAGRDARHYDLPFLFRFLDLIVRQDDAGAERLGVDQLQVDAITFRKDFLAAA